jgi:hypothetical protein
LVKIDEVLLFTVFSDRPSRLAVAEFDRPFVFLQLPALDMAAWLLMTPAFAYCAVKIIKTPNDEWDLPPLGLSTGAKI